MADNWLSTLLTDTPQEGYDLAVLMVRTAVKMTQADPAVRGELRAVYGKDADALIAVSTVVAAHFQTVAAANNYWRV
ncbi:hexameric tyrosine-coordinated heme protein [Leisingera daeponensis]|uniref:Hexameric tyrosine-coordinated heme protein n=1 Tax=Leisingera daeponensis TaxID=405746 RepID=A0ABS7NN33_9RHOB|nr:hexameric tyrosine-coordinated heme protein [Leisingera daeponensis]MBY6142222.1 hexameric tyrosine-coordinated heme protein [Leisingera daeponensis]